MIFLLVLLTEKALFWFIRFHKDVGAAKGSFRWPKNSNQIPYFSQNFYHDIKEKSCHELTCFKWISFSYFKERL